MEATKKLLTQEEKKILKREYEKRYRLANKDKCKQYQDNYRAKNKEKYNEYHRKYREEHREDLRIYYRLQKRIQKSRTKLNNELNEIENIILKHNSSKSKNKQFDNIENENLNNIDDKSLNNIENITIYVSEDLANEMNLLEINEL
jgi:hypothetical protein